MSNDVRVSASASDARLPHVLGDRLPTADDMRNDSFRPTSVVTRPISAAQYVCRFWATVRRQLRTCATCGTRRASSTSPCGSTRRWVIAQQACILAAVLARRVAALHSLCRGVYGAWEICLCCRFVPLPARLHQAKHASSVAAVALADALMVNSHTHCLLFSTPAAAGVHPPHAGRGHVLVSHSSYS